VPLELPTLLGLLIFGFICLYAVAAAADYVIVCLHLTSTKN